MIHIYQERPNINVYHPQVAWNKGAKTKAETRIKISSSKKNKEWTDARRAAQTKKENHDEH